MGDMDGGLIQLNKINKTVRFVDSLIKGEEKPYIPYNFIY